MKSEDIDFAKRKITQKSEKDNYKFCPNELKPKDIHYIVDSLDPISDTFSSNHIV